MIGTDGIGYLPALQPDIPVLDQSGSTDDGEVVTHTYAVLQANDWVEGIRLWLRYHDRN